MKLNLFGKKKSKPQERQWRNLNPNLGEGSKEGLGFVLNKETGKLEDSHGRVLNEPKWKGK